jgi:hypothetical protein
MALLLMNKARLSVKKNKSEKDIICVHLFILEILVELACSYEIHKNKRRCMPASCV